MNEIQLNSSLSCAEFIVIGASPSPVPQGEVQEAQKGGPGQDYKEGSGEIGFQNEFRKFDLN